MTPAQEFLELLEYKGLKPVPEQSVSTMLAELQERSSQVDQGSLDNNASVTLEAIADIGLSPETLAESEHMILDGTGRLALALSCLEQSLDQLKKGQPQIYFNVYPTDDFNAVAIGVRTGVLCLLDYGVPRLVYQAGLAASYLMTHLDHDDDIPIEDRATLSLAQLAIIYCRHDHIQRAIFPGDNAKAEQVHLANMIAVSMKAFIIAHEFAHVALGHVKPDPDWTPSTSRMFAHLGFAGRVSRYQQEYDADRMAQDLVSKSECPLMKIGGICTLQLLRIIELVRSKIANKPFVDDDSEWHPATSKRISRIETQFSLLDDPLRSIAEPLVRWFGYAFDQLQMADLSIKGGFINLKLAEK